MAISQQEIASGDLADQHHLRHIPFVRTKGKRDFSVIVERDGAGFYVASVPGLPGCHTQARSLDKLLERTREAVELCLEVERDFSPIIEFVGVQRITV